MKRLGLAVLACATMASAPAAAAPYVKYLITVTGTGTGAGSAANTNVPAYFTFTNTYTVYTYSGHDSFSSTSPAYTFALSSTGFDIDARLVNATNTYGHLVLAIDPSAFATSDVPVLTTNDIVQSNSSLTMSNGLYGTYTALSYSITTTTQSAPFLGSATPRLSFSLAPSPAAAPVPEPAVWSMMILGIGAVGFAMRRRKVTTRVSYAA